MENGLRKRAEIKGGFFSAGMGVGRGKWRKKEPRKDREKGHSQRREHPAAAFCSFFKAGDILWLDASIFTPPRAS